MIESPEFDVFPAIDVLGGACVRLLRGDYSAKTEYGSNPRAMAERWLAQGARWLHVVDLDGARDGLTVNFTAISEVVKAASEVGAHVQVGGGIRTAETLDRWLSTGVTRCIVGTAILNGDWVGDMVQRFGSDVLVAGLDGRDGNLAVRGWMEQTQTPLSEVAMKLAQFGLRHALVTDVQRDGAMQGANLELATKVQEASGLAVIASGGVRHTDDVLAARTAGLAGAILGRSLYDGTIDLPTTFLALQGVDEC